ncbi:MAG: Uncharacterized protein FD189_1311 [Elusimicrobia bacterium]|nr:MAG: Uncharacterized protein FD154_1535 [Elusimicrobiota bacterium]KAF0155718.1 MAG: Uncharacterized protein FD189_1311 [Elusimicrobiota bacterium]
MAKICAEADLKCIAKNCRFPDWLGYIGLVITCLYTPPMLEGEEFKRLSDEWLRQLSRMVKPDSNAYKTMSELLSSGQATIPLFFRLPIDYLEKAERDMLPEWTQGKSGRV